MIGSRLMAEIDTQRNLIRDPHKIAGIDQLPVNGFNKDWRGWNDINRMIFQVEMFKSVRKIFLQLVHFQRG